MTAEITFKTEMRGIDWEQMKARVAEDDFDNGRTSEQLRLSFENSFLSIVATHGDQVVGTARALSDGVCNAYIIDVWTYRPYRGQGVARKMMELIEARLAGQHIYLFTDSAVDFYQKLGYHKQPEGMGKVVGEWLRK